MDAGDIIVALVVAAALSFDFPNGFHDTANAMATSIATGALAPKLAVAIAAILNFVGAFSSRQDLLPRRDPPIAARRRRRAGDRMAMPRTSPAAVALIVVAFALTLPGLPTLLPVVPAGDLHDTSIVKLNYDACEMLG